MNAHKECKGNKKYEKMQGRVDELQDQINFNDNYIDWLKELMRGNVETKLDCLEQVRSVRQQVADRKQTVQDTQDVINKLYTYYREHNEGADAIS